MTTNIGSIHITQEIADDGDVLTNVTVDGDMHLVTQLGLLRLAEDTLINGGRE